MPKAVRNAAAIVLFLALGGVGFGVSRSHALDLTLPWLEAESSFEITETLVLDYHDENFDNSLWNDNYGDVRNRLNLKLAIKEFTLAARFDTSTFIQPPQSPSSGDEIPYLDRYSVFPEKISANYTGKRFQVTAGDFYASFGRGIILQLRKMDELGQDTTLLGAMASVQFDELEFVALAGFSNPTNADAIYEKVLADPYDLIGGVRSCYRLSDRLALGLQGVVVLFDPFEVNDQDEANSLPKHAYLAGATFEVPELLGDVNLYAEIDWLGKQTPILTAPGAEPLQENGWAGYLAANVPLTDLTFLMEFKYYRDFDLYTLTSSDNERHRIQQIYYVHPPTLEPNEMEVGNNQDVYGGRLKVSWRPGGADTQLLGAYSAFVAEDRAGAGERFIYHAQLGAEQDYLRTGRAKLSVGLREENPDYRAGSRKHLLYVNAQAKVPVGSQHSLELHGTNWWEHDFRPTKDYVKGEWILGYAWAPHLAISLILGYDTQPSGEKNLEVFYRPTGGGPIRQVFLAADLSVNLSSRLVIRLLGGQMRGGLKCVAGNCQEFPAFAGVRLETVVRL